MSAKARQRRLEQTVERFEAQLREVVTELARSIVEAELARAATASARVTAPAPKGRRAPWTRESVIDELSRWLVTSKNLDASFLKRHGPRGLVDAAKRIFGRFDAALNAANLAIAVRLQGTPPGDASQQEWPSMRELARRRRERRAATAPTT